MYNSCYDRARNRFFEYNDLLLSTRINITLEGYILSATTIRVTCQTLSVRCGN